MWGTGSNVLLKPVVKPRTGENPLPTAMGPEPLGASVSVQGPRGIVCSMDRILIDKKAEGAYAIKLALEIAKNGTVRTVVAESAPTPEVKSRIEQQAQDWIFEPYLKDGVGVNVKLSTIVHLTS